MRSFSKKTVEHYSNKNGNKPYLRGENVDGKIHIDGNINRKHIHYDHINSYQPSKIIFRKTPHPIKKSNKKTKKRGGSKNYTIRKTFFNRSKNL